MRVLIFGPPGVGKGTQARLLAERLGLAHVSTGQLIRDAIAAGDPAGLEAKAFIDQGKLAPDDIVRAMADRALAGLGYDRFILDGYPRNLRQAAWLDEFLAEQDAPLTAIVSIKVPVDDIVQRLSQRRVNKLTGENYHLTFNPPPLGLDPSLIVQREDDRPEAIRARLKIYDDQTREVEAFYQDRPAYHAVDGVGEIDEVNHRILAILRPHVVAEESA